MFFIAQNSFVVKMWGMLPLNKISTSLSVIVVVVLCYRTLYFWVPAYLVPYVITSRIINVTSQGSSFLKILL
jgi:hypothetical protein